MTNFDLNFRPFISDDIPLYLRWAELDHVKDTWFLDGYEPKEAIYKKVREKAHLYPYLILSKDRPVGYIQACDLFNDHKQSQEPEGVYKNPSENSWCIDLFIGDPEFLNRGYGTEILKRFSSYLFSQKKAQILLVDPDQENLRSVKAFQKAGFKQIDSKHDGVKYVLIMQKKRP